MRYSKKRAAPEVSVRPSVRASVRIAYGRVGTLRNLESTVLGVIWSRDLNGTTFRSRRDILRHYI